MERFVRRFRHFAALLALLGLAAPARAILFYTSLPHNGAGKARFCPPRPIDPTAIGVPCGYCIEPVVTGLTYPTAVATDEYGRIYILEAGYSYGEDFRLPRLMRIEPNGAVSTVAVGRNNGPWTGMSYHQGAFYVSEGGEVEGGRILRITPDGRITALVEGLPSMGDHHTNRPVVGPDGYLYFGVGTATNSGVVGHDNAKFGWLKRHPQLCDVPPVDVVLAGRNFVGDNALKPGVHEPVVTGAYVPYGTRTYPGQVIPGRLPCNGAILRIPLAGGPMEWVAWGFRNPFGLAFAPDGQLYTTDNMYDERGVRPVFGAGDLLWRVQPGLWYGFPDYWGNIPLEHPRFEEKPHQPRPQRLLAHHPNVPPEPVARLAVRSSSDGMDFSRNPYFGHVGQAFIAVFGDISGPPDNGKVRRPVGCRVVRVDLCTGVVQDFVINKGKEAGPGSKECNGGIERPVDVKFNNDGSLLYVVDFGVMTVSPCGPTPYAGTGVLWRVRRSCACPTCVAAADYEPEGYYRRGEAIGRPVIVSDAQQLRGQAVYFRNCYHCHQGGEGGLGPALLRLAPGPVIRTQIRAGLGVMPGFSTCEIPPDDMDALITYLKTSRRSAGFYPHVGPCDVSPLGR
jgi:glucose/arabinose dehydrogenase/cytochrome c5